MSDLSVLQCECENLEHEKFDVVSTQEMCQKTTVHDVFNDSYCVMVPLEYIDERENLSSHETLVDLKGKMGVYGLWIHQSDCYDHDMHRMFCLYVGKGYALNRVKKHIENKWPETQLLYVTFYECENRIAKYIEQLFLDNYNFPLNIEENIGEGYLATAWDGERYTIGTNLHEISNRLAEKFPERFQQNRLTKPSI
jgi:hypothetical protein